MLQHIRQITGFDGGHHGLTTKAAIGQELGIYLVAPQEWPHPPTSAKLCAEWLQLMTLAPDLSPDDWRRICDALRYLGRDLHHRSFSVSSRRELLWEEMDRCLNLADRLAQASQPGMKVGNAGRDPELRFFESGSPKLRALGQRLDLAPRRGHSPQR